MISRQTSRALLPRAPTYAGVSSGQNRLCVLHACQRTSKQVRADITDGKRKTETHPYCFAGANAICSITSACDPPRSYSLPFAVTLLPANSISFAFCPLAGIVSAMGQ